MQEDAEGGGGCSAVLEEIKEHKLSYNSEESPSSTTCSDCGSLA